MDSYQISQAYRTYYVIHPFRYRSTKRAIQIIIGLNTVVFGAWAFAEATRNQKLYAYLHQNALLSWANVKAKHYWTLVTSAFSHQNFLHFMFNMVSLNAFASVFLYTAGVGLGAGHVVALTLGSALSGSFAFLYGRWIAAKGKDARFGPYGQHITTLSQAGLGASGVVMGFSAAATCLAPFTPMSFMFIPVPIPMFVLTGAYFVLDVVLLGSNDRVGHDAHIGGAVFGLFYYFAALRRFGGVTELIRRRWMR